MFQDRVDEIKAITNKDLVQLTEDPEVVTIYDFLSPLDIKYLLDKATALTESISEDSIDTYRLSPYIDEHIKLICIKIASIVDMPLEHLNYINLYNLKSNQRLEIKDFTLPKIQESHVATSPNGNIQAVGVLALTTAPFTLVNVPLVADAGTLAMAKTVDVDPEVCNNTILASYTSDDDVWFCTFKFTEKPRTLNEVIL